MPIRFPAGSRNVATTSRALGSTGFTISPPAETTASTAAAALPTMMYTISPGSAATGRPRTHVPLTYDPRLVTQLPPVPLHSGAERYYREVGYLK